MTTNNEIATLAGGCFWCTEAIFTRLNGVKSVKPGYAGGTIENPTYEEVCDGDSGHAEAIQIEFDPQEITFAKILDVFWATHNPTTLNQQGNDVGPQYRSVIFYHTPEQKIEAENAKEQAENSGQWSDPVVTEIVPFTNFFVAEDYHQRYFEKNSGAPYCQLVIAPKIHKLSNLYKKDLKDEYQREQS